MTFKTAVLPPDPGGLITALRSIGYKLNAAIADLVDNSLDAKATEVLVRFVHDKTHILQIMVADNGKGMNESDLHEAMRFGRNDDIPEDRLGKYGLGMKLSSLSQSTSFAVASRRSYSSKPCGRRWTVEGIRDGWQIETLDRRAISKYLPSKIGPVNIGKHGTVVVWENLDRLPVRTGEVDKAINRYKRSIERYLGLVFHRLLGQTKKQVRFFVDSQQMGRKETTASLTTVEILDPFGYERTTQNPPHIMEAELGDDSLMLHCHTWPPNSETPNYKLPKGPARAQGLYVYRNKRLIQYGGWAGLRETEADPHLSLARVMIDLPTKLDHKFGLDLKKASIQPPPAFVPAVQNAKASDGMTFKRYIAIADRTYRHKDAKAKHALPAVPGKGVAMQLRPKVRKLLAANGKVKEIDIVWEKFDGPEVFYLDVEGNRLLLNKAYRKRLLGGRRASQSDAQDLKLLLFLLVREDYNNQRLSKKRRETIEQINELLTFICIST